MEYTTETFPRETIKTIAGEFHDYFRRRSRGNLTLREARMMIDHVVGSVPPPTGARAKDYSRAKVSGRGGNPRPTAEQIRAIESRREEQEPHSWDAVFDELIEKSRKQKGTIRFIHLTFREGLSYIAIQHELSVGQSTLYRLRRTILEQAAVIAVKKGLIKY